MLVGGQAILVSRGPLCVDPFDLLGSIGHDVALLHAEFGSPSPTAWGGEIDPQSDVTGQKWRFFGHRSHVYRSNALKFTANMHRIET